jgi:pimeloyl-ACP methyl ester carboxylesterase
MRSIDVDVAPGVKLRVRHWPGKADDTGPPFLLVHGLSSNARLWDGVARVLAAAGHPAYAVDLRSHGESDAPPDGYDTATAAEDLAALSRRLRLAPAVVAGQSWGGNVVVRLAARHPELVAGLALVDGGWIDLSGRFDSWAAAEAALRPPDVDGLRAEDLRRMLTGSHPGWSDEAIEATLANLRVAEDGTLRRRLSVPDHMRIVRSMWDDPPWPDFGYITAPVLLMPALASANERRAELVVKAAGALARARIHEYVGGDHDRHAQQPEAVAADLLALAGEA